jgi:hypothetical protein
VKKLNEHPLVKLYMASTALKRQCEQCIRPWQDGICECQMWGKQQEFMKEMASRLLRDGWVEE